MQQIPDAARRLAAVAGMLRSAIAEVRAGIAQMDAIDDDDEAQTLAEAGRDELRRLEAILAEAEGRADG